MNRFRAAPALSLAAVGLVLAAAIAPGAAAHAAAAPALAVTHSVTVSGTGVTSYPAFSSGIDRYAVRTTDATQGSVNVLASSSDSQGTVSINGRPAPNGTAVPLTGLQSGDEIAVTFSDSSGVATDTYLYLPSDFPELRVTTDSDAAGPGYVFLGLISFLSPKTFEAVIDRHGVPVYVGTGGGTDFKALADGNYSIARPMSPGSSDYRIVKLDPMFAPISSYRMASQPTTDFHDSILEADGSAVLMGYNLGPTSEGTAVNATFEVQDPNGNATFTWNSADHAVPSDGYLHPGGDYAHMNSIAHIPGSSDVLVSFRNLSTVMRIATTAHDGHQPGDVVWQLGGKHNQFTFDDPGFAGFCAQHTAVYLANDDVMLYDDGSKLDPNAGPLAPQTADMCPNPADPTGPRIARPQTRAVEYHLDTTTMTATRVWQYVPQDRYSIFAGSTQRLANGDTFIGWSQANSTSSPSTEQPIASEVNSNGDVLWQVFGGGYFSYRAYKFPAPDHIAPTAQLVAPQDGAVYPEGASVTADYGCVDRGGSSLQTCVGNVAPGQPVDLTPGSHTFVVTATDGAGNVTRARHLYRVEPAAQPDGRVRTASGAWVGDNVYGSSATQRITVTVHGRAGSHGSRVAYVNIQNDGTKADRFSLKGTASSRSFRVSYWHAGVSLTHAVTAGTYRTPLLAAGHSYTVQLTLTRTSSASNGTQRTFYVGARSLANSSRWDSVAAVIRARR